jgi:hypothetical protein
LPLHSTKPASAISICRNSARRPKAAARSGDTDALWRIYDKHIKKAEAQEALGELIR